MSDHENLIEIETEDGDIQSTALTQLRDMAEEGDLPESAKELLAEAEGDQTLLLAACIGALSALGAKSLDISPDLLDRIEAEDIGVTINSGDSGGISVTLD